MGQAQTLSANFEHFELVCKMEVIKVRVKENKKILPPSQPFCKSVL
jgi:hypothetical protein